jgi:HEAT repeat protein
VLVRRLDDPFPDVRMVALAGLARTGDRSVIDPVLARLSDRVPMVRAQAIMALAELGDPRVRPQLEALLERDGDGNVQRALAAALSKLPH